MTHPLDAVVRRQHSGEAVGITSVCSAHPWVLRAAVEQAVDDGSLLLIEATSNQVDQFGGYTGLQPADFRDLVHQIADAHGLPRDRVVLGGDHLGPNTWRDRSASDAMILAEGLVAAYVLAGFTKIHLDCSYPCGNDEAPLTDGIVAERAARLMRVALDVAPDPAALRFVIGTEVPAPGGADHEIERLKATTAASAHATIAAHRTAFATAGLENAWSQVMGLVVQPGVEFDHLRVVDYSRADTEGLRRVVNDEPHMVFEAHSTDYQTVGSLTELVEDHWAVLKVGPALTFALREAVYALAAIEDETVAAADRSRLREVVETRMLADPSRWLAYYPGDAETQRLGRTYSFSDRTRYYWPDPEIQRAQLRLVANLNAQLPPLPLLSAHLPDQYTRVRAGALQPHPVALVVDKIRDVLRGYAQACATGQVGAHSARGRRRRGRPDPGPHLGDDETAAI